MKVAFIVSSFPSLSETFILNQITGLLASGVDVEIFAHVRPEDETIHPAVLDYELFSRVHYFHVPPNRIVRVLKLIIPACRLLKKNRSILLRTLRIFFLKEFLLSKKRKLPFLGLLYYVLPFLNKSFDVVHCHFGPNGILGAYLKEIFRDFKLITSFHGFDLTAYLEEHGREVYSDLFARGDIFLPISEYFRNKLLDSGCDRNKVVVHHMGVDIEKFNLAEIKAIKTEKVLLTVGRMVEKKGHEYSIKAFLKLSRKYPDMTYLIVGDGPLRSSLEMLASGLEAGKIKFLGPLSQDEIIELYGEADIFVLSSVTSDTGDREGIPVVLIEAQACGLPVVSTCHSGIPEVVADGETGFLVPERDEDALSERIEILINNPGLRERMGKRGRSLVDEKFNIRKLNKRLIGIYENCAG